MQGTVGETKNGALLVNPNESKTVGLQEAITTAVQGSSDLQAPKNATEAQKQQVENVRQLAEQLKQLSAANNLTPAKQEALTKAILDSNGAIKTTKVTLDDFSGALSQTSGATANLASEFDQQSASAQASAQALAEQTQQQRLSTDAARLEAAIAGDVSTTLQNLLKRYQDGKISASDYAKSQDDVSRASKLAAQLVAAAGTELARFPIFAGAAAKGQDALTQAVFKMIVQSSSNLPVFDQLIGRIVSLGAAAAGAAAIANANPIIIRTIIAPPVSANAHTVAGGFSEGLDQTGQVVHNVPTSSSSTTSGILAQLNSLLAGFVKSLSGGTNAALGIGPSSSGGSGSKPQASIVDIGDLPKEKLADAIALAIRLRNAIPGQTAADKNDIVNLLKGADFLKQVKGVDSDLLRRAIEELTNIESSGSKRSNRFSPTLW